MDIKDKKSLSIKNLHKSFHIFAHSMTVKEP